MERALRQENLDVAGGKVLDKGREVGVRTVSTKRDPLELLDVPVAVRDGHTVRVRDIARVVDATADVQNISRVGGRTAVRLGLRKGDGENTIEVAEAGRAEGQALQAAYPELEAWRVAHGVLPVALEVLDLPGQVDRAELRAAIPEWHTLGVSTPAEIATPSRSI